MTPTESFAYFNGMAAACCLCFSLLCGLQLCTGLFSSNPYADKSFSRLLGITLLIVACSVTCYILAPTSDTLVFLVTVASALDHILFIGVALLAYVLYANNQPSRRTLVLISAPFILLTLLNIFMPEMTGLLNNIAAFILTAIYIAFGIALHKREKHLDRLYSDPESHSLKWIWGIIALFIGWWILHLLFICTDFSDWHDVTMYLYISALILFATVKVSRYRSPVSFETQMEIEESDISRNPVVVPDQTNPLQQQLLRLLEEENIYLNPDLKIDDVARLLGTNAKTLSTILNNDMQTSFSTLINTYRINRAIHLLRNNDEKVTNLSYQCGFNSNPVFFRAFAKITGQTPSEWRKSQHVEHHDITLNRKK